MAENQKRLKIGIIGYGKMGQAIEQAAIQEGCLIGAIVTKKSSSKEFDSLKECDVAIEFTSPDQAVENIKKAAKLGISLVVGTTGWESHLLEVRQIVQSASIGLLYSPNFSLGMHIFQKMIAYACRHFSTFASFDVGGFEMHHNQKKDIPSGTAKAISSVVLDNFPSKKRVSFSNQPYEGGNEVFSFSSLRLGSVFGEHSLLFDSPEETITLTHSAKSRSVFAKGALFAASWLKDKKGLYCFDDCLNSYFSE